jgi:hypothetical protein
MRETSIDIANLSFSVDKIEEVTLSKIFISEPQTTKPSAYSVAWTEWVGNGIAKAEPEVTKTRNIQRFENYELARMFFISKVDEISKAYKEK